MPLFARGLQATGQPTAAPSPARTAALVALPAPSLANAKHRPKPERAPGCDGCPACVFEPGHDCHVCDLTGVQVVVPDWPLGKPADICPATLTALEGRQYRDLVLPVLEQIMARGKAELLRRVRAGS